MLLEEGTPAPAFTLPSDSGEDVSLSDFAGKNVVLYFYPRDNTPGCTNQACDFRDNMAQLTALGAVVLGVSGDSIKSHVKFRDKFELPFKLLSDASHDMMTDYGVWQLKKNYGREYMGIVRTTYIIDGGGVVRKVFPKVRVHKKKKGEIVRRHVEDVQEALEALTE